MDNLKSTLLHLIPSNSYKFIFTQTPNKGSTLCAETTWVPTSVTGISTRRLEAFHPTERQHHITVSLIFCQEPEFPQYRYSEVSQPLLVTEHLMYAHQELMGQQIQSLLSVR